MLTLTLSDPMGISNVLGSPYDDTIIGNARDNTLIGGGGDDLIAGLGGNDVLEGGITRTVYLDFNTDTMPGDHVYTQDEQDGILTAARGRLRRLFLHVHADAARRPARIPRSISTTRR